MRVADPRISEVNDSFLLDEMNVSSSDDILSDLLDEVPVSW